MNLQSDLPYDRLYVNRSRKIDSFREQFIQLLRITWDGDLISKTLRDELVRLGFVDRIEGYNIVSKKGIKYLHDNDLINP